MTNEKSQIDIGRLLELITSQDYSIEQQNFLIGLPHSYLYQILNKKKKNLKSSTLIKLANYYGVTVDYLLGR